MRRVFEKAEGMLVVMCNEVAVCDKLVAGAGDDRTGA